MELLTGGGGGGLLGHFGSSQILEVRSQQQSRASTPPMKVRTQIIHKAPLHTSQLTGSFRGSLVGKDAQNHLRGMSSSLVVVQENYNKNQTPFYKGNTQSIKENDPVISQRNSKIQVQFTPQKTSNRYLNPQVIQAAVQQKIHPIHLVRAAALRAKISSEQKKDQISRLELQKETIKHLKERNAQEVFVIDAPKTRAQEEKEAFFSRSNIKNNPITQEDRQDMSLQPNKFNLTGWDYKKMQDIKLRSNLVKDHLQGKYCGRGEMSSKKDAERYRPQKIFKTTYQKLHAENSRNKVKGVISTQLGQIDTDIAGEYDYDIKMVGTHKTINHTVDHRDKHKGNAMMDLLYKSNNLLEAERDQTIFPKNDYAPPFVSSLNFNFNMNDVFGSAKKAPALLKSTNESKSVTDVLSSMKQSLDSQRRTIESTLNAVKIFNINQVGGSIPVGSRSVPRVKNITDNPILGGFKYEIVKSPNPKHDQTTEQDEEMKVLRRKLHSHILKNQYSFWAGMYVKRLTGGLGRPNAEDLTLSNKGNRMTVEGVLNNAYNRSSNQDSRNFQQQRSSSTAAGAIPLVDFGDPRSLTQCINFNRKKLPYLPEQEFRSNGATKLIAPAPRQKPPQHPAKNLVAAVGGNKSQKKK